MNHEKNINEGYIRRTSDKSRIFAFHIGIKPTTYTGDVKKTKICGHDNAGVFESGTGQYSCSISNNHNAFPTVRGIIKIN